MRSWQAGKGAHNECRKSKTAGIHLRRKETRVDANRQGGPQRSLKIEGIVTYGVATRFVSIRGAFPETHFVFPAKGLPGTADRG